MTVWLHAEFFKRDDRVQDLRELTVTSATTQAKKKKKERKVVCNAQSLASVTTGLLLCLSTSVNFSSNFQFAFEALFLVSKMMLAIQRQRLLTLICH